MKQFTLTGLAGVIAVTFSACHSETPVPAPDYTTYVNTLIGTDSTGNTYPGAQVPFGMVQLSPDNGLPGSDRTSGYFYQDSTIAGFSHTHLSGAGAGNLSDISFMPAMLPATEAGQPLTRVHSRFSHDDETATAGYYQVRLTDYDINVELTATDRCGIQRYTFPEGSAAVILNLANAMSREATLDSSIKVVDSVTIEGYRVSDGLAQNQRLWFRTRFSEPWDSVRIDSTPIIRAGKETGMAETACFYFSTDADDRITVATSLSCTGLDGAKLNLVSEVPDDDFEKYRKQAHDVWHNALSGISVAGDNDEDKTKFYTALYHSMLAPTIYCDIDGSYMGPDNNIHNSTCWQNYSTFSLWDTYRAAHPLMTYLQPDRAHDFACSLIAFGRQNLRLPVWTFQAAETDMKTGYHSVPVIVDAYIKGLLPDNLKHDALDLCVTTANNDTYRQIGVYKTLGYVPYDHIDEYNSADWSLSKTLEYAFDDYCIALMAQELGRQEVADEFYNRAMNYKNVYNPQSGFMQPRDSQGNFIDRFNPEDYSGHIYESNAWQYLWSVQHDIDGLIEIMGGKERFLQKLDSMMTFSPAADSTMPDYSTGTIGQYAQGNKPSHHVIYLFNKAGRPDLTQKYVSEAVNRLYDTTPAGLCGNEGCGQMSAWFAFSAMGFYPVNPVSGRYELGTPLFKSIALRLDNGNTFRISAPALSKENIYIRSARLNGEPYDETYITHEQIMNGAHLELEMTANP